MFGKVVTAVTTALLVSANALAAEGMWQPDNLPLAGLKGAYDFSPNADWIAHAQRSSLRLTGSCSGSFVSPNGLVLTAQQCVNACVQKLSHPGRNYLETGYYARSNQEELACPGLGADRLDAIEDVTARVKSALGAPSAGGGVGGERAVREAIERECVRQDDAKTRCEVVSLYGGSVYSLYRYRHFSDVRLVFAPESAVANFGGDPNNFEFPRYGLDVALLRVYDGGKPAGAADYFPLSASGAQPGELTIAIGNPRGGARQKTLAQVQTEKDRDVAHGIARFGELRGVLTRYSAESAEHRRIAQADLANVEKLYKSLRGRFEALQNPAMLERKRAAEQELRRFVADDPARQAKYGAAWDEIARAQETYREIELPFQFMEGRGGFFSKYLGFARALVRGAAERQAGEHGEPAPEVLSETQQLLSTAPIYPDYEKLKFAFTLTQVRDGLGLYHPFTHKVIGNGSPRSAAERLVNGTKLADLSLRMALRDGGAQAIEQSDDSFIVIARSIEPEARAVRKRMDDYDALIARNSRLIEQARFEKFGGSAYPNPTFTQRFSFGTVDGWKDGERSVDPFSDIGGAFARSTSEEPFVLPKSWLAAKDTLNLKQRLNFLSSNDVIGGDLGAPLINRNRELVGVAYGGNYAALGGEHWFDERTNRAVSVHSGAVLEVLRKIYNADRIVGELEAAGRQSVRSRRASSASGDRHR